MARKKPSKRAVAVLEKEELIDAVAGAAIVAKFPGEASMLKIPPFKPGVKRCHEELCNLASDISTATKLVSLGELWFLENHALMDTFCSHLSLTLKKCLNMFDSKPTCVDTILSDDMIEMVIVSVEFVTAITRLLVKDHFKLPLFLKLVYMIRVILDEENAFFKIRHEILGHKKFQIVLNDSRLARAERSVCGLYVGSGKDSEFYPSGCRCTRWNSVARQNKACSACIEGSRTDAVITYIRWLLGKTVHGCIYLWLLDVLKSIPDDDTFQDLDHLLRPYALLCISFDARDEDIHVEQDGSGNFVQTFLNHLDCLSGHWSIGYASFEKLIGYLYVASKSSATSRGWATELQLKAWECLITRGKPEIACAGVNSALRSTFPPFLGKSLVFNRRFLEWMNTEDVILKLLKADYKRDDLTKVLELVETIREKGFIHEPVVQSLLKCDILRTEEQEFVHESIAADVIDSSDLSSISTESLEIIIGWLEKCKVPTPASAIGQTLASVLKKLPFCDKERKHERRLLDLFWKHMVLGRSQEFTLSSNFIDFMTKFAGHYVLANDKKELQDVATHGDDIARLLENWFSGESTSLFKICNQEPDHVDAFVQEAKRWETIEQLNLCQIPTRKQLFEKVLDLETSIKRQDILKDYIPQWLHTISNLTADVDNFSCEALGPTRDSISLPAMRVLEALKNESSIHSQAGQKFKELSAQHLQEYANLRSSYHRSLETFLERCLSEKADVVKEALYSTAKVVAYKDLARISISEVSTHEALKRMLQNNELRINSDKERKQVSVSESTCAICYDGFGEFRKRACLGPCGHAQACLQCANREYDRTKTCPICQGCIEKPIPLNYKVFF